MNKFVIGFICVAALTGASAATTPSEAQNNCPACGPRVTTSYQYKNVQRVRNVTRYKDVNRTHVVNRVHRIVTVTRVQPVTHVNMVTRVHNRTVVKNSVQHVAQTRMMPTRTITTAKTIQLGRRCPCG